MKKNSPKSTELLNKYMNSGGKEATYDDIAEAVKRERLIETINLWKKRLSFESFMLYAQYIVFGKSAVKQQEWTVILPDESKVSAVKEKELLTPTQFNVLFVFRSLYVILEFLTKVIGYIVGTVAFIVLIV